MRRRVQLIFQDPIASLNPRRRICDIIAEPLVISGVKDPQKRKQLVCDALTAVGLDPELVIGRLPHEFSGGQCQRICIARALVLNPDFIICDGALRHVGKLMLEAYDPKNCDKVLPDTTGLGSFIYGSHYCSVDNKQDAQTLACGYFESGIRVFDIRDPLHPKVSASFTDLGGYSHPHSFLRLPNGHVLASFQHTDPADVGAPADGKGGSGGLVEIDDQGHVIRAASTADPEVPGANLMPYSLLPLPDLDRVVVTNSSMHDVDPHGHTFQVWSLSTLKLLSTEYFDTGGEQEGDINPEEPRLGPDGSIFVQTLNCGIERITGVATDHPKSQLVHMFPGSHCGVPTIVGHYLIQSVPIINGVIVLDLKDPAKPTEVSRLPMGEGFVPHWTGWDAKAERVVVTGIGDLHRLFMLKLDQQTGVITMDTAFRDVDGKAGFNFDDRHWPGGWTGSANPHGVVFSR
jgi:hypothetical protein